jgi:hypothetical protein
MAKAIRIATIISIILMITIGNFSVIAQPGHPGGEMESETGVLTYTGQTNEGSSWEETLDLESEWEKQGGVELDGIMVMDIEFVLTWSDDEGSNSEPDTFSIAAMDGMGEPLMGSDSSGEIEVTKEGTMEGPPVNDTWDVVVTCENAGDTPLIRSGGFITENDPGNSWELTITFHYVESGGMGGPPANVREVLESPIFKIHIALMVMSYFLFLGTGLIAGVFGYNKIKGGTIGRPGSFFQKLFARPDLLIFLVVLTFLAFFIAAIPIGIWVAGKFYGWHKAWTGFPALWNPEAWQMTNADNVSFLVLFLWAVPMYINRAQIMRSKYFKKLFGWSKFAMKRVEKAPEPKIPNGILALCYFFMGIFTFVIFAVQPHGSGS